MKKHQLITIVSACLLSLSAFGQNSIPVSTKELAPNFGIRPIFLDDTVHISRYLDSLDGPASALTDTCVTLNAKLMALSNVMLYDYRHSNDTVWIDATHYIEDYKTYTQRINTLSQYILDRAHGYIEQEHRRIDNIQQNALRQCKDTIDRQHRTIVNTCEGIGVSSKERKKELRDIYYNYLSVYNRYDFSMKRNDTNYLNSLNEFSRFQKHLIDNLLSNSNYSARINNFINTLKVRCENGHVDVLRSYQRTFRQPMPPVNFSSIKSYYNYINSLETIIEVQNSYLAVIDLREKINATNKRINSLYYPRSHDVAKTYQEVAATVNMVPAFNSITEAETFIKNLQEFTQVQDCYIQDYNRLTQIQANGDSIVKRCGMRYNDVAKAYRQLSSINSMSPNYMTLDDAARFGLEMERFEHLQRQYDTIITFRQQIDDYKDTISKGWMSHLKVYNAFQNIRKQFVLTPTFIDAAGGSEFISQLNDCIEMEITCINTISLAEQSKVLGDKISSKIQPYRNLRKAYNTLENEYMTMRTVNHVSELIIYLQQLEAFITVQNAVWNRLQNDAANTDKQLKGLKEINQIEITLGL